VCVLLLLVFYPEVIGATAQELLHPIHDQLKSTKFTSLSTIDN